ncbi:copper chaperone PCu(A)C [Alteromonas sp. D210916BOD_24]|uniref:copper chaperone PCu(A)C n=1 Tax=Alteromonas sp. D210916BOD_24 TaxID=3157618 RepID=UPI00399CB816
MSSFSSFCRFLFLLVLSATLSLSASAQQHEHKHIASSDETESGIMVMNGYARATFAMAKTAAVYFTLHNTTDHPITLTQVAVDNAVADEAQIHTTEMQGDVMKMRELTEGVQIGGQAMVNFQSGGYHVMLLGLQKGLTEGSDVALTLTFDHTKTLDIVLPVKQSQQHGHHHH